MSFSWWKVFSMPDVSVGLIQNTNKPKARTMRISLGKVLSIEAEAVE